jgi:hypothetical protein
MERVNSRIGWIPLLQYHWIKGIVLTLLLLGFWLVASPVALAQSDFQIEGVAVLTLRTPEGGTEARLATLQERFEHIVSGAAGPPLIVKAQGDDKQARILINDQVLLEVTQEDAAANATTQVIALAELWANKLQTVLGQSDVQGKLFRTLGLPTQVQLGNFYYTQQALAVQDLGRFTTDGTRAQGYVIFWEDPMSEQGKLPDPAPETVYLLNARREFIAYSR